MANFEATVRFLDLVESDAAAARRTVEERLRTAGFSRWQIVSLGIKGATAPRAVRAARAPSRPMPSQTEVSYAAGGLLVAGVAAWALWFLWLLAG